MSVNLVNQTDASLAPIAGATIYADEPVGSVKIWMSDTIPNGYLLCNGQAISKTTYADLYAVIGSTFGETSTTFNVPDLRGEFLRGAGTNSHSGQGNGGSVGTHQDATRQMGSYEGSGDMITLKPLDGDKKTDPNTCDTIISTTQHAWYYHTDYVDAKSDLVLQYTARPTNTSVNFIIKATTISLPSDFEAAVDEKIDDALERTSVVIAGNDATGLLLEKSGHVICAEYNGVNAATIITGTIPEAYRPSRDVLSTGTLISDNKSYVCWVWFCSNGTINGSYAPFNGTPVSFNSTSTSWSVHGCASWIVP